MCVRELLLLFGLVSFNNDTKCDVYQFVATDRSSKSFDQSDVNEERERAHTCRSLNDKIKVRNGGRQGGMAKRGL